MGGFLRALRACVRACGGVELEKFIRRIKDDKVVR